MYPFFNTNAVLSTAALSFPKQFCHSDFKCDSQGDTDDDAHDENRLVAEVIHGMLPFTYKKSLARINLRDSS